MVYITATAPYLLFIVLLVRASMLKGAGAGILYYITPRFEPLLTFQVITAVFI